MRHNVEGHAELYKDASSGGVITRATAEHSSRVNARKRINNMVEEFKDLKEEMAEIKQLLRDIKNGN